MGGDSYKPGLPSSMSAAPPPIEAGEAWKIRRVIRRLRNWSMAGKVALPILTAGICNSVVLQMSSSLVAVAHGVGALGSVGYAFLVVTGRTRVAATWLCGLLLLHELLILFFAAFFARTAEFDEVARLTYLIHDAIGHAAVGSMLGSQRLPRLHVATVLVIATALRAVTCWLGYLGTSEELRDSWLPVLFPYTAGARVLGCLVAKGTSNLFFCGPVADVLEDGLLKAEAGATGGKLEAPSGKRLGNGVVDTRAYASSQTGSSSSFTSATSTTTTITNSGSGGSRGRRIRFSGLEELEADALAQREQRTHALDHLVRGTVDELRQPGSTLAVTGAAGAGAPHHPPAPSDTVGGGGGGGGGIEAATGALLARAFDGGGLAPLMQARRVRSSELQLELETIGSGSFGVVHRATWVRETAPPQLVAAKLMHRHRIRPAELEAFKRTVELELQLRPHRNVCRLLCWACCAESARLLVALEHCPGGTLAAALESGEAATWLPRLKLRIARELCDGLAFLHGHEPPIVHRDLKPANVLFDGSRHAKICDLGACRLDDQSSIMSSSVGTPLFRAPEQLAHGRYGCAVDVWAAGCVFTCLALATRLPYPAADVDDALLGRVARGEARPAVPCESPLLAAVEACARFEAEARPTAAQLLAHELPSCQPPRLELLGVG